MATKELDEPNTLYYGDNLDILKRYVDDDSVDLVYLDPPFNSAQSYNVLFAAKDGTDSAAQIRVFEDTWHWDESAAAAYFQTVEAGGRVSEIMQAFRMFLGDNDMLAYLSMMAPRLVEMRRVLKATGSLYLHCDPTASHYLKLLLDAVFGPEMFRNEIIWKRTSGHSDAGKYGNVHDVILYYVKTADATWNQIYQAYDKDYVEQYYRYQDANGRRWMSGDMSAAGLSGGGYEYEWNGITRVWRCPRETMERLDSEGRIFYTKNGIARRKRYLDESEGLPAQDLWTDIEALRSWHDERLGYPTQKPEALLERILSASSNLGDIVLDPFCGCGTTIAAAQKLGRHWIGIDVTYLAINLIRKRLRDTYQDKVKFRVIGEPTTIDEAEQLAGSEPYQFQYWALGLVHARPTQEKKGADKGIDGRLYFHDEGKQGKDTRQVIFSVKAGHVTSSQVRDLVGVITREKAEIGVLISFEEPTRDMRKEAASAGFYESPWGRHPKVQLLTVRELLEGKTVDMPRTAGTNQTFKKAPKVKGVREAHPELFGAEE